MLTIIDTGPWSLMLRRRDPGQLTQYERAVRLAGRDLIAGADVVLLGAVRQELLSGVRDAVQYGRLREQIAVIPDEPCSQADYERAAEFANSCRWRGVQGSPTDFLLCSVAARLEASILTTDPDFAHFALHLPIQLHPLSVSTG